MSVEAGQQDQYRRLLQVMELLGKAEASLNRNRVRLFEQQKVDAAWILSVNEVPEREYLLESFASKFNSLGDNLF